jgi:hypothetical protein
MDVFKKIEAKDIIILAIGVIVGGLLIGKTPVSSDAVVGMFGVLIGAFIPSIFQSWGCKT